MLTYQDYLKAAETAPFMARAISEHRNSKPYRTAMDADLYDRRRNVTVNSYVSMIQSRTKNPLVDITAANNRIASNFFHRLNTQRCAYSLGNGVSFTAKERRFNENGYPVQVDIVKERLGPRFDTDLYEWAYKALIHGVSFGFWNYDRLYVFPLTEFVPLWDEESGALRAGVRFWRLAPEKPWTAVLYTEEGFATYKSRAGTTGLDLVLSEDMRPYVEAVAATEADGERVVGAENYGTLPIVPMWGSRLKQSTLVGMREQIDSYDLIQSGFANDVLDCAKIYWLIQNCGGMNEKDLQEFLDNIRINHVAKVDTQSFDGDTRSALSPYVQDVPYQSNEAYLQQARAAIYEGFGALDVHTIAAGSTNDHIDAAYQPMDEEADDFEYQIIEAVQAVLRLMGIEDTPQFKRNRVANVKEQIEAVILEANMLDAEAVLDLLPNVTVDMKEAILARRDTLNAQRLIATPTTQTTPPADADEQDEGGANE